MTQWTPIFERDDVKFLLAYRDMLADSESNAREIGLNVEDQHGAEVGFRFVDTFEVKEFHAIRAELSGLEVLIISGPIYNETLNNE